MSNATTAMTEEEAQKKHWYIKINKRESGPYQYNEVVLMIYNEDVKPEDMITCRGLGGWKILSDFCHFSVGSTKKYFEENNINPEDHETIHFRRSMRVPLEETVLAVSGNQLFKAHCIDVSTNGCMIKVPRGKVPTNTTIKIHIYNNEKKNYPAFNLKGSVVRTVPQKREKTDSVLFDHLGIEFNHNQKSQKEKLQTTLRNMVFNYEEEKEKEEEKGKIAETFKRAS